MSKTLRLKRPLAGVAAGAMTLSLLPGLAVAQEAEPRDVCEGAESGQFTDTENATARDAINCVADYDIALGFPDNTYRPNQNVQRGSMASFIARTMETAQDDELSQAPSPFVDIIGSTHQDNIEKLYTNDVVLGTTPDPTTYEPNIDVTRGQMASFIVRSMDELGADLPEDADDDRFTDVQGTTHEDNINIIAELGITVGATGGDTYDPEAPVRRGQMALFITRMAQELENQGLWNATLVDDREETFEVTMSWINETDGEGNFRQGEPGAEGSATITVTEADNVVEFDVDYSDVTGPFGDAPGFHIHEGDFDENGPIVVDLATGEELDAGDGQLSGTVEADDFDVSELLDNPEGFYLNLHSDAYPDGAIRGQLPDGGQDLIPEPVLPTTFTDAPELVDVDVTTVDTSENGEIVANYTFDAPIVDINEGEFKMYDYTADAITGDSAEQVASDTVEVTFDLGADEDANEELFESLTTAAVAEGAVIGEGTELANPEGALGVQDVTIVEEFEILSAQPNLVNVARTSAQPPIADNQTRVVFTYDADVDDALDSGDLSIILTDGETRVPCADDAANNGNDNQLVALCDSRILDGELARGVDGPGGANDVIQTASLSTTETPDLQEIDFLSQNRADFVFDEQVRIFEAAGEVDDSDDIAAGAPRDAVLDQFAIYNSDGDVVSPERVVVTSNRNVVRAQFDQGDLDASFGADATVADDAVGAFVEEGAVTERFGDRRINLEDEARISGDDEEITIEAGTTLAPDLVSVGELEVASTDLGGNPATFTVEYTFDDDVDTFGAGDFVLYTADGDRFVAADAEVSDDDNVVIATFAAAGDVEDAVLGTVEADAVDGDPFTNPEGAAGVGVDNG